MDNLPPMVVEARVKPITIGIVQGRPVFHVDIRFEGDAALELLLLRYEMDCPEQAIPVELIQEALRARGATMEARVRERLRLVRGDQPTPSLGEQVDQAIEEGRNKDDD